MSDHNLEAEVLKAQHKKTLAQMARATNIPKIMLKCRVGGDGHNWKEIQAEGPISRGTLNRAQKCKRCGCIKKWIQSTRYGIVLHGPNYIHVEGYMLPRDPAKAKLGRLLPPAVRLMLAKEIAGEPLPTADEVISEWEQMSNGN